MDQVSRRPAARRRIMRALLVAHSVLLGSVFVIAYTSYPWECDGCAAPWLRIVVDRALPALGISLMVSSIVFEDELSSGLTSVGMILPPLLAMIWLSTAWVRFFT